MLQRRIPLFPDILRVTGVIATFLYGWTIIAWLWQLPSWLLSLTLGEILSIFAYSMFTALLESLFFLACLLILTFALPPRFLRDDFTVRASWLTIGTLGSLVIFFILFNTLGTFLAQYIILWSLATLLLAALLASLSNRFRWMRSTALWISDRFLIFLFLFAPITVVSLLTLLVRNL
jgi:hypothetical protein